MLLAAEDLQLAASLLAHRHGRCQVDYLQFPAQSHLILLIKCRPPLAKTLLRHFMTGLLRNHTGMDTLKADAEGCLAKFDPSKLVGITANCLETGGEVQKQRHRGK